MPFLIRYGDRGPMVTLTSRWRRATTIPSLLGVLLLGACESGSSVADRAVLDGAGRPVEWNGTITLASAPSGASCTVTRDGVRVADIGATPAQVRLARANSPATVTCTAAGRLPTTVTLYPLRDLGLHHHQPTGPTGTEEHRRDIETGRVRRFFDTTVVLLPANFASIAERDAYFAARAEAVRAYWAEPIARAERAARAAFNGMIDSPETLRGYMNADLAMLDRQKAATTVGGRRGRG